MSDVEDDYVSDDGEYEEREEKQEVVPEIKSADSFDLGNSMDEFDGDEDDCERRGSLDSDDSMTLQSNNRNNVSVAYSENTDDRSKFQQACFDTMQMLRSTASKAANQVDTKKALDMVYETCKARFHAKERLGSSGASEYLYFLFKRWRHDTELMIRCSKVISEFILNETENKILMGIQGISREIVLALDEHRRHWPAIHVLTELVIDLCNSKLPGMLQQNIMHVAKPKADISTISEQQDSHLDSNVFEKTRLGESAEEEVITIPPNQSTEQSGVTMEILNQFAEELKYPEGNIEALGDGGVSVLGAQSILDEDQWLSDNREKLGKAGVCHILTHIISLLCEYQDAHVSQNSAAVLPSSRRATMVPSDSHSGHATPSHHSRHSTLGGHVTNETPFAHQLPPIVNSAAELVSSSSESRYQSRPQSGVLSYQNPSLDNGIPSSISHGSGTHSFPETLRLQLPPIVTVANRQSSSIISSKINTPKGTAENQENPQFEENNDDTNTSRPISAIGHISGNISVRTPHHLPSPSSLQPPTIDRQSFHQRNPNDALQKVLYTDHNWSFDDLIIVLMRAVAVLSDYEPNAKRFGREGLYKYITHLLTDKTATSVSTIHSARENIEEMSSAEALPTPRNNINGPRTAAHFSQTNALLWAMIMLCADSTIGNKELFGQAGATFLLIDRLHEIMRNVDIYRKDTDSRRYVEYVSWALLNLVLDCPMNCILLRQVTYADVVLDHLITMEIEVLVPAPNEPLRPGTQQKRMSSTKAQAKDILMRASFMGNIASVSSAVEESRKASHGHGHNNAPMMVKKEIAMTLGTRQKLGRIKKLVYRLKK